MEEDDDAVGIQLTLMRVEENMEKAMMRRIGELEDKSTERVALEVVPALIEALAGELYQVRKAITELQNAVGGGGN